MKSKLLLLFPALLLMGILGTFYKADASTNINSPYTTSHTRTITTTESYTETVNCTYECGEKRLKCDSSWQAGKKPWYDTRNPAAAPSDCKPYAEICRSANCNHVYCSNIPSALTSIDITKTRDVSVDEEYKRCHYISKVNKWSNTCVNNARVATDVTWKSVLGTSCSNVPLTQYCYDGKCGNLDGKNQTTWPQADGLLCDAGDASSVSKTDTLWKWKCLGFNRGKDDSCQATPSTGGETPTGNAQEKPNFQNN